MQYPDKTLTVTAAPAGLDDFHAKGHNALFASPARCCVKASWWKTALKYAIGATLLTYTIASNWESHDKAIGLREALSRPIQIETYLLAAAFVAANTALTFVRWYLLVRAQNLPFTLKSAFRLGLVGYFYNTFLPGSVGGDLLKAAYIAREQERRTVAVATVLIDRAIGLWGLVVIVALTGSAFWLFAPEMMQDQPYLRQTVKISLVLLAVTVAMWGILGILPERRAQRFARRLNSIPKIGGAMSEFWRAVWLYRSKGKTILAALGLSLVGHTCSVLAFYLAVVTFQPAGDLSAVPGLREHFLVVPVGMTAQGFFPAPGGVGGGEFAYGWLYEVVLGFPAATGILGCLGVRVLSWIFGAAGYVAHTFMKRESEELTAEPGPTLVTSVN